MKAPTKRILYKIISTLIGISNFLIPCLITLAGATACATDGATDGATIV